MAEPKSPISLPTYAIGDEADPNHLVSSTPRDVAAEEARSLEVGDAAFVLRSGRKWCYAILLEKTDESGGMLRFEVDAGSGRKSLPMAVWGKYVRTIKVDEAEMARLEAEASGPAEEEEEGAETGEEGVEVNEEDGKKLEGDDSENVEEEEPATIDSDKEEGIEAAAAAAAVSKTEEEEEENDAEEDANEETGSMCGDEEGPERKEEAEKEKKVKDANEETESKCDDKAGPERKEEAKKEKNVKNAEKTDHKPSPSPWKGFTSGISSMFSSFGLSSRKKQTNESSKPTAVESKKSEETRSEEESEPPPSPEPALLAPGEDRDSAGENDVEPPPPPTPAEPIEPPKPDIQLLETPIRMFKAPTMTEDPALAALAATSFADDRSLRGVVVCEADPAAAAASQALARERLRRPGEVHADIEAEMKRQGITVVENDECSVATEKAGVVAARASPVYPW